LLPEAFSSLISENNVYFNWKLTVAYTRRHYVLQREITKFANIYGREIWILAQFNKIQKIDPDSITDKEKVR